jgi:hypothetical protein
LSAPGFETAPFSPNQAKPERSVNHSVNAGDSGMCKKSLEARVRIELTHKGFADLSLTTWVPRLWLPLTTSISAARRGVEAHFETVLPHEAGKTLFPMPHMTYASPRFGPGPGPKYPDKQIWRHGGKR